MDGLSFSHTRLNASKLILANQVATISATNLFPWRQLRTDSHCLYDDVSTLKVKYELINFWVCLCCSVVTAIKSAKTYLPEISTHFPTIYVGLRHLLWICWPLEGDISSARVRHRTTSSGPCWDPEFIKQFNIINSLKTRNHQLFSLSLSLWWTLNFNTST